MKKNISLISAFLCIMLGFSACEKTADNSFFVGGPETANFNSGGMAQEDDKDASEEEEMDWESIEIIPEKTSDSQVKIMSFNVRVLGDSGNNAWDVRKKGIPVMVKTINPTTIGVQEATKTHLDYLAKNLTDYAYVGEGREGGTRGESTAIFYKKEEVELIKSGTFWLSETPHQVSYGWNAQYLRIATWAIFKKKATNEFFFHMNTHLDFDDVTVANEVALIARKCLEYNPNNYPGAFTGDMNTKENDSCFEPMKQLGYVSARRQARDTDESMTFNGFGSAGGIIDHVFSSVFKASKFKVVNEKYNGVTYLSDHYPVYAILDFPLEN